MVNKVILIGNLGKDPEVRRLESGSVVANFSLATNESYKDNNGDWKDITEWHNIVCWRGLAESAERNLRKGQQVYIEGKVTYRKWQDSEGKDRYTTDIVANTFRKLGRKEGSGNNFPSAADEPPMVAKTNTGNNISTPAAPVTPMTNQTPSPVKDFSNDKTAEDDLPF